VHKADHNLVAKKRDFYTTDSGGGAVLIFLSFYEKRSKINTYRQKDTNMKRINHLHNNIYMYCIGNIPQRPPPSGEEVYQPISYGLKYEKGLEKWGKCEKKKHKGK
jgi:hypothetical protein